MDLVNCFGQCSTLPSLDGKLASGWMAPIGVFINAGFGDLNSFVGGLLLGGKLGEGDPKGTTTASCFPILLLLWCHWIQQFLLSQTVLVPGGQVCPGASEASSKCAHNKAFGGSEILQLLLQLVHTLVFLPHSSKSLLGFHCDGIWGLLFFHG